MDNPDAQKVISDYQRFGVEIPEDLTPPPLHDIEWTYWQAFIDLSTERALGMGKPGSIPWSAIHRYADEKSGTDRETLTRIIRAMDSAFLGHESGESRSFSREMMRH